MASTDGLIERLTKILDEQARRIEITQQADGDRPLGRWEMSGLTDAMHALVAVKKVSKDEAVDPEMARLWRLSTFLNEHRITPEEATVHLRHLLEDGKIGPAAPAAREPV